MCHLLWDYVEKARTPSNVLECSRRLAPSSVGASGERLSGRIATYRSHCNTNASVTVLIIRGWLRVRVAAARIQGKKSKFDSKFGAYIPYQLHIHLFATITMQLLRQQKEVAIGVEIRRRVY